MRINDTEFNVELMDILTELQNQLRVNQIPFLNKIKDAGNDIMVTCPFHKDGQERRPSAGIRKSDGLFHCLACKETHSLPEVISYCFGKDAIYGGWGWTWLLKNFATIDVENRKDIPLDFNRTTKSTKKKEIVLDEELDSYRYIHPYMYQRGLTDDVIELFDIGYDKDSQCITFPVRDIEGDTLFVARRSVNSKFFNYPRGVEKPLYGLYELYKDTVGFKAKIDEVIVTESMLDALSFWVIGKWAVALNGLGNELQFKQLQELPCRKLILATDMDASGMAARERIRVNMQNTKLITEYVFPTGKKDANDCTPEELKNLLETF